MNAEKTYLVRRSDSGDREYRLYELTWLWRTAELPHDAVFKASSGEWRPVSELIEPILENERQKKSRKPTLSAPATHACRWWVATVGAVVVATISLWPALEHKYNAWKVAKTEEREALERERSARTEDFVSSTQIIPGMTPEQVRRTIGAPKTMKATADAGLERWIYRKQIVVFENGKVIGVEELNQH